jgi:hypothetical protein
MVFPFLLWSWTLPRAWSSRTQAEKFGCWDKVCRFHSFLFPKVLVQPAKAKMQMKALVWEQGA